MNHSRMFIILFSISCFLGSGILIQGQLTYNYWIYQLTETEDFYEVQRTNAITLTTEVVTSVDKIPTFTLRSIMPEAELATAELWFTGSVSSPIGSSIPDYFQNPPDTIIRSIVPSPDNTILALSIRYVSCSGQMFFKCFGVSQIILVDIVTGQQTLLWSLPSVADSIFFPYCYTDFIYTESGVDTGIAELRWTPDQEAIVAKIYYESSALPPDNPLVVIPIHAPQNAFVAGNGEGGWTISPNSNSIASLSRDCDSQRHDNDIVRITTFDLETNQHRFQDYGLPAEISRLSRLFSPAFVQDQLVFPIAQSVPNEGATGPIYRLGQLDPTQVNSISIVSGTISSFRSIIASPSADVAVVEDVEGYLWKLELDGNSFSIIPITSNPVSYWQFANDEELVVLTTGQIQYTIVPIPRP